MGKKQIDGLRAYLANLSPNEDLGRNRARRRAYTALSESDRAGVDAVIGRVLDLKMRNVGPDTACEIVAAIGELLATGRARE